MSIYNYNYLTAVRNTFLRLNGTEYDQVNRLIKEALSTEDMIPPPPPLPGLYTILISSEARRYFNEFKRQQIIHHLSHSEQMNNKYYKLEDARDATKAHATISAFSTMRRWKENEITELVNKWPLSVVPPMIKEPRDFIKSMKYTRIAKDVLNKWIQLKSKTEADSML